MQKINTKNIPIPLWATEDHKVHKAYNDGKRHANSHYFEEAIDPDWPYNVKSWAVNPYSENRPAAFYSWMAGFCEEWSNLVRADRELPEI